MNWLDAAIVSLLILGLVYGFAAGLGGSIVSLLSVIVGYVMAGRFYVGLAEYLVTYLRSPPVAGFVSFLLIFTAVLVAFRVVHMLGRHLFGTSGVSFRSRVFGGLLGLIMGAVLSSVVLVMVMVISPESEETIKTSRLGPFFSRSARFAITSLPEDMIWKLDEKLDRILGERWGEGLEGLKEGRGSPADETSDAP